MAMNTPSHPTGSIDYVACLALVHKALRRQRGLILLQAAGGVIGTVLTPVLLGLIALLMMFYIVILVLLNKDVAAEHMGVTAFFVFLLIYAVLFFFAWKREKTIRSYYYKSSQKKPPEEFCPPGTTVPLYYIPLGSDLMHDDVPPHWLIRLPSIWAGLLVRVWLQWQVYRYVKKADAGTAALFLLELARAGESVNTDKLSADQWPHPRLHVALSVLFILDLAAINTNWSKVWLHHTTMDQLGLVRSQDKAIAP